MKIGIIAALPGELKPLVHGWASDVPSAGTRRWTYRNGDDIWIAVCAGMGADAARRAFSAAEADGALQIVLSVGWAGALDRGIRPGEARMVSVIIDGQTHKRYLLDGERRNLTLVTAARVADAAEKIQLRLEYPDAMIVDMEAATVAQLAQDRGLAMGCVKGISDGVGAEMPDLRQFINSMGQLRMGPFLAYLAVRPKYWKSIIELGRNSAIAASSIRDLVLEFLEEKNVERIRTGST